MDVKRMLIPLTLGVVAIVLFALAVVIVVRPSAEPAPAVPIASPASADAAGQRWFFAEGCSLLPYRTFYAILNPGRETAQVTVALYLDSGKRAQRTLSVAANTEVSVAADTIAPDAVFGAEIVSTQPVYVQRLTLGARDGTTAPGLKSAQDWYFPEAQAGGDYETRLVILNPGALPAQVMVSFLPTSGQSSERIFAVPAQSRRAIMVSQYSGPRPLALVVRSDGPIVAEHVTYSDGGLALYGSPGATPDQLSKTWYAPMANTQAGFATRVAVLNPNDAPANVRVTVVVNGKRTTLPFAAVAPHSKRDITLPNTAGAARVALELAADRPIAAQTVTTYKSSGDGAIASHSSLAVPVTARQWYLPGTASDDDNDSYLSVFNPGPGNAVINVTYAIGGEGSVTKRYAVASLGRLTMAVRDEAPATAPGDKAAVFAVKSDRPVAVGRVTMFRRSVGATESAGIPER
jgi:hypothetical protein